MARGGKRWQGGTVRSMRYSSLVLQVQTLWTKAMVFTCLKALKHSRTTDGPYQTTCCQHHWLPSTPQSSWRPYSGTHFTQNSWAFRTHVPGPPDEPITLKPVVLEIIHPSNMGLLHSGFFYLVWTLRSLRSSMMTPRPFEIVTPRNGKSYFTMMSCHFNNNYAKTRGIAKNVLFAVRTVMHQEQVDMVAGDFNGAAWRRKCGKDQRRNSTIEEAFANTNLPIPHGPSPLWRPSGFP